MKILILRVTIILLTVTLGIDVSNGQTCTYRSIFDCAEHFYGHDVLYNGLESLNETTFDETCRQVPITVACIASSGCPVDTCFMEIVWNGYKDAFTYLCGKKSDVLTKFSCWQTSTAKSGLTDCRRPYHDDDHFHSMTCSDDNNLLSCYKSVLTSNCGSDSANLYVSFNYKLIKTWAKAIIGCTLDSAYDTSGDGEPVSTSYGPISSSDWPVSSLILVLAALGSVLALLN